MKKVLVRAVSGSIYVALIVCTLLLPSPYLFLGVFAIFIIMGIRELHHLVDNERGIMRKRIIIMLDCIGGIALFSLFFISSSKMVVGTLSQLPLIVYLAYIAVRMILQLYLKNDNALQSYGHSCLTQVYVALPLSLLNILYFQYDPVILLAIFVLIWLNDTGAFCVGSLFGKHRLFERISPKKSWEGFWGGMFFCIVAGIVFYYVLGDTFFGHRALPQWIGLGIIVSAFATWGDLIESLLKRTLNVKDSGHVMPGHGGILDRIDSLLLVSPIAVLFFLLIEIIL